MSLKNQKWENGRDLMDIITVYCDGGCRGNQDFKNVGGWCAILEYKGSTKEIKNDY